MEDERLGKDERFAEAMQSADSKNSNMPAFRGDDGETELQGIRGKAVFDLAKTFIDMPLNEIEALLDSP